MSIETDDDDEALRQALRNVWPILSSDGRKQAINAVASMEGNQ